MSQGDIDPEQLLPDIIRAAEDTGALIASLYGTDRIEVFTKESGEHSCSADTEAESLAIDLLSNLIPGARLLSEEFGTKENDSDWRWIIDPLDGTLNFIQKLPWFCVSIALEHVPSQTIMAGVVHAPLLRQTYSASNGGGAMLNQAPITPSAYRDERLISVNPRLISGGRLPEPALSLTRTRPNRYMGSCALDLCYVASGIFSHAVMRDVRSWDVAAGQCIIEEAGGTISENESVFIASMETTPDQ